MGHQQLGFIKSTWKTRYNHGGELRKKKNGRGARPLSSKDPLHLVFKANRSCLSERSLRGYRSFALIQRIIQKYAKYFFVKVEQVSIQGDHVHLLVRCGRRSRFQHFFRVVAGQIAQVLEKEGLARKNPQMTDTPAGLLRRGLGLWKHRPFSRVVKGFLGYQIVRNYIQLNEKEARGEIRYNSRRLRGLSAGEWAILWT